MVNLYPLWRNLFPVLPASPVPEANVGLCSAFRSGSVSATFPVLSTPSHRPSTLLSLPLPLDTSVSPTIISFSLLTFIGMIYLLYIIYLSTLWLQYL